MKKLLTFGLALLLTLTLSACAVAEKTDGVMTHAEFVAAAVDTEVTVETYVQATQSWWNDKITVYCQTEDGAYFLYDMPCSKEDAEKLVPGTKLRVTGYKAEWSGEVEIIDATFEILEGSYIAEATDVTDLFYDEKLAEHMNEFVVFKGLTVEPSKDPAGNEVPYLFNYDGSGQEGQSDLYFFVSLNGGKPVQFTVRRFLCGTDSEVHQAVKNLKIGDTIDLEGFLYWYNGANTHTTSVQVVAK